MHTYRGPTPFGIVVWDTRDAPHMRVVTKSTIDCARGVRALTVARNGCLVAGCFDDTLCVVDVDAGVVVATLAAHAWTMASLLDGRVASAGGDGNVRLWDLDTRTCVATLRGHSGSISSLVVMSDGRLASAGWGYAVRLWDTATGTCIRVLSGHTNCVHALAVLPDDQLASLSADGTIRVWNARTDAGGVGGSLLARPPLVVDCGGSDLCRAALAALPGNRLVTGGKCMYVWQLPPL